MNKKIVSLLAVTSLMLAACGGDENEDREEQIEQEEQEKDILENEELDQFIANYELGQLEKPEERLKGHGVIGGEVSGEELLEESDPVRLADSLKLYNGAVSGSLSDGQFIIGDQVKAGHFELTADVGTTVTIENADGHLLYEHTFGENDLSFIYLVPEDRLIVDGEAQITVSKDSRTGVTTEESGMWVVGSDIETGNYVIVARGLGKVRVLSASGEEQFSEEITDDNKTVSISLKEGDYLVTTGIYDVQMNEEQGSQEQSNQEQDNREQDNREQEN